MKYELSKIEKELLTKLIDTISKNQNLPLEYTLTFHTLWIQNYENNLGFRYVIFNNQLIVSRVQFHYKHQGCMTECFDVLKEFSKKLDYTKIVIQSVQTKEMANWCLKNGFIPNAYCMKFDDMLMGDYEFTLNN